MEKSMQIDVLPPKEGFTSSTIHLYVGGDCFTLLASKDQVDYMVCAGLVKQVKGQRHNSNNELESFDYPEGVDSAGVKYTSDLFELKTKEVAKV